jgi:hypothetical protein
VHTPVAKSTVCTAQIIVRPSSPPMRSTWPCSLSLSSITIAAALPRGAHDSGGRAFDLQGVSFCDWSGQTGVGRTTVVTRCVFFEL